MRPNLVLIATLCLALILPAGALGATPKQTSKQDTAVAYYLSPEMSPSA
jgi:hypothetical protein